jgi:hypothetical protein
MFCHNFQNELMRAFIFILAVLALLVSITNGQTPTTTVLPNPNQGAPTGPPNTAPPVNPPPGIIGAPNTPGTPVPAPTSYDRGDTYFTNASPLTCGGITSAMVVGALVVLL